MHRQHLIMGIAVAVGSALAVAAAASAQDRSPVHYTRDQSATLVQKDVDDQEWTITYELASGDVTGNVRSADGSATFLDCDRLAVDDGMVRFECFVAEGCTSGSCDPLLWTPAGEVEVPEAFFLPDEPVFAAGCCDLGGPCVDSGPSPQACVEVGGAFVPGTRCEVIGPLDECPDGVPAEFCFEGTCTR
jgi:hypothetical protein